MYTGLGAATDANGGAVVSLDPNSPTVNTDLATALRAGQTVNVGKYCFGGECPGPLNTINGAASGTIYSLYEYLPSGMSGYPTAAATYYDGTIRDRTGMVLGTDPTLVATLLANGLGPFPSPPAPANGTEVHVALSGGVGSAPAVTLVNQSTAIATDYATAPNQVVVEPGVTVPQSAILAGPVTLPDGVIVVAYTTPAGATVFLAQPGPGYVAPQLVPGDLPVGGYNICGLVPGTGGWYVGNALGYNCPQPPPGYSGGYALMSAALLAAWHQMLSDVAAASGVAHDMTNSSPLPGGVMLGTSDFQMLGEDQDPTANGAPLLAPLTATGAAWNPNDVNISVVGSTPVANPAVVQPAVSTAPEVDESGTLDVQVTPYVSPTGEDGSTPTVDTSAQVAMTGNAPSTSNSGLLLGLLALGAVGIYATSGKRR